MAGVIKFSFLPPPQKKKLVEVHADGMVWHEEFQNLAQQHGLKGKKLSKVCIRASGIIAVLSYVYPLWNMVFRFIKCS